MNWRSRVLTCRPTTPCSSSCSSKVVSCWAWPGQLVAVFAMTVGAPPADAARQYALCCSPPGLSMQPGGAAEPGMLRTLSLWRPRIGRFDTELMRPQQRVLSARWRREDQCLVRDWARVLGLAIKDGKTGASRAQTADRRTDLSSNLTGSPRFALDRQSGQRIPSSWRVWMLGCARGARFVMINSRRRCGRAVW